MSKGQKNPIVVQTVVLEGPIPIVVQARMLPTQQHDLEAQALLPPSKEQGEWRFDTCERCCTCTGDCWVSWCCPCFQLGQLSTKVKNITGRTIGSYTFIVGFAVTGYLLPSILAIWEIDGSIITTIVSFVMFIMLCQLRGSIRRLRGINPNDCEDCMCSYCCFACTITQLIGEMWAEPERVPGCDVSERPGSLL